MRRIVIEGQQVLHFLEWIRSAHYSKQQSKDKTCAMFGDEQSSGLHCVPFNAIEVAVLAKRCGPLPIADVVVIMLKTQSLSHNS